MPSSQVVTGSPLYTSCEDGGAAHGLVSALGKYMQITQEQCNICSQFQKTAAVHTKGKTLQVYRMFDRNAKIAENIRTVSSSINTWDSLSDWSSLGSEWNTLQKGIESRMERHTKQVPILTKGIAWEGRPILIHAYKFEPDPFMKLELLAPKKAVEEQELPLSIMASILRCHRVLVPDFLANARAPYERHETEFETISNYLSQTMPKGLYATECLHNYCS